MEESTNKVASVTYFEYGLKHITSLNPVFEIETVLLSIVVIDGA